MINISPKFMAYLDFKKDYQTIYICTYLSSKYDKLGALLFAGSLHFRAQIIQVHRLRLNKYWINFFYRYKQALGLLRDTKLTGAC